jgi:shikimate kinase
MKSPPQIIELVGPAGAGKSTLARALQQCNENIAVVAHPYWRDPGQLPFFARNSLALAPTIAQLMYRRNGRSLRREEIAWMVILHGWHHQLRRQAALNRETLLLDQGAITMLASIQATGSGILSGAWADEWWHGMYRQWANTLDAVIWLDAPNSTLVPRIRGREQAHEIKETPDGMAFRSLDEYREIYKRIFSALTAERSNLAVLRFNTAQECQDELCDKVGAALDLNCRERGYGDD